MKILITGVAGFIGFHACSSLIRSGHKVFGIDNLNDYYDVNLKKERLSLLKKFDSFFFSKIDISDNQKLSALFKKNNFDKVLHLAAQPGVQYSIINPDIFIK